MFVYIDPNTGGMLFQVLAVLFAAISGLLLLFSRQIKIFFSRMRRQLRKNSTVEEEENRPPGSS